MAKQENSNASKASVGPVVDELKEKFKAGSVPLSDDYSNLIDMADCGRKALGQSPSQSSSPPARGLEVDKEGKLNVKVVEGSGLKFQSDGSMCLEHPVGPQGEPGTPGKQGIQGIQGIQGVQGYPGANGRDGSTGIPSGAVMFWPYGSPVPDGWHVYYPNSSWQYDHDPVLDLRIRGNASPSSERGSVALSYTKDRDSAVSGSQYLILIQKY